MINMLLSELMVKLEQAFVEHGDIKVGFKNNNSVSFIGDIVEECVLTEDEDGRIWKEHALVFYPKTLEEDYEDEQENTSD